MSELPPSDERRRLRRRRTRSEQVPADPGAWRSAGIVAGVAVALTIVGLLAPVPSADEGAVGEAQPVDSSTVVCPEPGSVGAALTTSIITVIPGLPGQDRPGESVVEFLEGGEGDGSGGVDAAATTTAVEPQGELAEPGDVVQLAEEESRLPALEVRTLGGIAPGLVAAQTTRDSFSEGRGLASQPCLGPDTTWWFVGGGSTAGRESNLVLVNPELTPAELEVAISGPDGPVSTPRLKGLVVEPRSRVVVRLSREAPRLAAAAWRVTVRQGRVTAALSDKEEDGFVPRGADWIPASTDPATRVLIPGVVGGEGTRQLLVHAPGDLTATVRVRLITAGGSFVPAATPEIEVPGGSVVAVDLDESLRGDDATVDLQSDLPIVAGMRQRLAEGGESTGAFEETAFTAGAPMIGSIAATTGLPAERSTSVTVWITAPDDIIEIERAPMPDMQDSGAEMDMSEAESPTAAPSESASASPASDDTLAPTPSGTGAQAVTVTLSVLGISEEGTPLPASEDITVTVPRGRVVAVDIPRPKGAAWFTAVATVSGGDVVIAHRADRRTKDGTLVTGYPWRPLRSTVIVPRAVPDPGLAVSGG
jgi:hypothetical protein